LIEFAGKVTGSEVGRRAAAPPPTRVVVEPKGGSYCGKLRAMGAPFPIVPTDARETQEVLLTIDEYGAKNCGWEPR
jgi:hypothetical protein